MATKWLKQIVAYPVMELQKNTALWINQYISNQTFYRFANPQ
jgi:hypothetical protein